MFFCLFMDELFLFVDGSVDAQSKTGWGASLAIDKLDFPVEKLKPLVRLNYFEDTSSSKLELQNLLWALSLLQPGLKRITIFTDSQNIVSLPGRFEKLEQSNYLTKKNKPIKNKELYQQFFKATRQINCTFIKVDGHKRSHQKNTIDKLFTLVDKASRKALRNTQP